MIIFRIARHTKPNLANVTLVTGIDTLFLVAIDGTRDGKRYAVRRIGLSPIIGRPNETLG